MLSLLSIAIAVVVTLFLLSKAIAKSKEKLIAKVGYACLTCMFIKKIGVIFFFKVLSDF